MLIYLKIDKGNLKTPTWFREQFDLCGSHYKTIVFHWFFWFQIGFRSEWKKAWTMKVHGVWKW